MKFNFILNLMVIKMKISIKYIFGMLIALFSISASAMPTIASWSFNLPSTAIPSQNPPYPLVATLTLQQVGSNVLFTLDPNELSPGVDDPLTSFVNRIDFVYSGRALTVGDYASIKASSFNMSPDALIKTVKYETNPNNMDSGYKSNDEHIVIDFFPKFRNTNPNYRFGFNDTGSWTIAGVNLSDFTGTYATHNSHPSPNFGVISVAPYTLGGDKVCGPTGTENCNGTSSNWVTGPIAVAAVPEPETYAMLLAGLGLLGFSARRKSKHV